MQLFSWSKIHFTLSSITYRPWCACLNVLDSHIHLMPLLRLWYLIILSISPFAFRNRSLIKTANLRPSSQLLGFPAVMGPRGQWNCFNLVILLWWPKPKLGRHLGCIFSGWNPSANPWRLLKTYTIYVAVFVIKFQLAKFRCSIVFKKLYLVMIWWKYHQLSTGNRVTKMLCDIANSPAAHKYKCTLGISIRDIVALMCRNHEYPWVLSYVLSHHMLTLEIYIQPARMCKLAKKRRHTSLSLNSNQPSCYVSAIQTL